MVTLTMDLAGDVAGPVFFIDDVNGSLGQATGVYDGSSTTTFTLTAVDSTNINSLTAADAATAGTPVAGAIVQTPETTSVTALDLPAGVSWDSTNQEFTLDPTDAAYQSLADGVTQQVTVSYDVTDGVTNVATSTSWTVTGTNDAPTVTAALTDTVTEDGAVSTVDLLSGATDADVGDTLMVNLPHAQVADGVTIEVGVFSATQISPLSDVVFGTSGSGAHIFGAVTEQFANGTDGAEGYQYVSSTTSEADNTVITVSLNGGSTFLTSSDMDVYIGDQQPNLPAGVTYDHAGDTLTLNPSDPAYQSLADGITQDVVVNYTIEDGHGGSVGQTVTWTVTGADDIPTAVAEISSSATEDGTAVTVDALENVSDVDSGGTLSVDESSLPSTTSEQPTGNVTLTMDLAGDVAGPVFFIDDVNGSLGQATGVYDGSSTTTFTLTAVDSTNINSLTAADAATAGTPVAGAIVQTPETTSVTALDLPAGVSWDSTNQEFTLDPTDAAYQSLADGVTQQVTVSYDVTDGVTNVATSTSWTVTGTNDAPVVDLNGGGFGVDMAVGVTEASELPSDADAHYDTRYSLVADGSNNLVETATNANLEMWMALTLLV